MRFSAKQLSRAAVIAAIYVAVCFFFKPLSFGIIQLRISEALCISSIFMPEAIWGLFIGCVISNLTSGSSAILVDVIFGSLTTLVCAYLTRRIYLKTKNLYLSLVPPVVLNAVIVGIYIPIIYSITLNTPIPVFLFSILSVGIGQLISVYLIGLPLAKALIKTKFLTFR